MDCSCPLPDIQLMVLDKYEAQLYMDIHMFHINSVFPQNKSTNVLYI